MKLGFLQVYNEVNWVEYAIDQAMLMCDKLLITEGSQFTSFPDIPERSDDGTLDIISDKSKQYGKRITCLNTTRKHKNYRYNQCDNFNRALMFCNKGDYFIQLDADEFYFDKWISEANELMKERKVDVIEALNRAFAFSFKWCVDRNQARVKPTVIKKTKGLHFVPAHLHKNAGENVMMIPEIGCHHYDWVKPPERMLIRMRTSVMYSGMVEWFEEIYLKIKPEDSEIYPGYNAEFALRKYDGSHPSVLDHHPWHQIEDVRKII